MLSSCLVKHVPGNRSQITLALAMQLGSALTNYHGTGFAQPQSLQPKELSACDALMS